MMLRSLAATELLALPAAAFAVLLSTPDGEYGLVRWMGVELVTLRVDSLSWMFGIIFLIATWLGMIYALHENDWLQPTAGLIYAGSAICAVFAGDLVTLFVFWEGMALSSVFLIWARRPEGAYHTGMRYLIIQIASGVILLAGAALH